MTVLYLHCEGCVLAVALVPEINSNHTEAKSLWENTAAFVPCVQKCGERLRNRRKIDLKRRQEGAVIK